MPNLKIECTNLRTQNGKVVAIIWDEAAHFRSSDTAAAVRSVKAAASAAAVTIEIADLPAGKYAIAVLHDENDNDRLDVTPHLNLPKEGMAFSNNPGMGLSGPTWDDCVFDHSADTTISVALKYWG